MLDGRGAHDAHVAAIRDIEHAADAAARKVFLAANRTFNAPIDREDIIELANRLDDAVDLIEDTAKGIQRYGVVAFPRRRARRSPMPSCAALTVLHRIMPLLDAITPRVPHHPRAVRGGRADRGGSRPALRRMRSSRCAPSCAPASSTPSAYIDRKEIYELLEDVVDRCDDVANTVQAITAKHA